jgi:hypothetical protein
VAKMAHSRFEKLKRTLKKLKSALDHIEWSKIILEMLVSEILGMIFDRINRC